LQIEAEGQENDVSFAELLDIDAISQVGKLKFTRKSLTSHNSGLFLNK